MVRKMAKGNSFINRKRPAVESLVEDWLGPASRLDELIIGKPLPVAKETEAADEEDADSESENRPG